MPLMPDTDTFHPTHNIEAPAYDPVTLYSRLGLLRNARRPMADEIRRGFPIGVIDRLNQELEISQQNLLKILALSSATLTRRRREQQTLNPQESGRVYRLVSVYRAAIELFEGDLMAARRWLKTPAKALGGHTPLEHIDNEAGADDVENLIGRLEHGILS